MRQILILLFILAGGPLTAHGTSPCRTDLLDSQPEFETELTLNAARQQVTYRSVSFYVSRREYILLYAILEAGDEVATYESLRTSFWPDPDDRPAIESIKVAKSALVAKFRQIDPEFNKIKNKARVGPYWVKSRSDVLVRGRVSVSEHVYEGYADGKVVPITPVQHAILMSLVSLGEWVYAPEPAASKAGVHTQIANLNRKFESALGAWLLRNSARRTSRYVFNEALNNGSKPCTAKP